MALTKRRARDDPTRLSQPRRNPGSEVPFRISSLRLSCNSEKHSEKHRRVACYSSRVAAAAPLARAESQVLPGERCQAALSTVAGFVQIALPF